MTVSLPAYDLISLPGEGPEDVVVGPDGVIYTGLRDGRVLAVAPEDGAVREVANTGGRPLGLEATADGRLLICDSPKGLLELDLKTGALRTLVTHDGVELLQIARLVDDQVVGSWGDAGGRQIARPVVARHQARQVLELVLVVSLLRVPVLDPRPMRLGDLRLQREHGVRAKVVQRSPNFEAQRRKEDAP